jgi:hypothetical protein
MDLQPLKGYGRVQPKDKGRLQRPLGIAPECERDGCAFTAACLRLAGQADQERDVAVGTVSATVRPPRELVRPPSSCCTCS